MSWSDFLQWQQIYPPKGSDLLWGTPQSLINNTGFRFPGKSCCSARLITHFRQIPTPRSRPGVGLVSCRLWLYGVYRDTCTCTWRKSRQQGTVERNVYLEVVNPNGLVISKKEVNILDTISELKTRDIPDLPEEHARRMKHLV